MAIRIDRVYTRTGDGGETGLAGGMRVSKDSPRIEAFGTVDELNSWLGVVAEEIRGLAPPVLEAALAELADPLARVQQQLFNLGAFLATPPVKLQAGMPGVGDSEIRDLEGEMDRWNERLPALKSFVLPGGGKLGAFLHVARAVCRRAERETIRLHREEPLAAPAVPYLNRLSDWLFVAARLAAKLQGVPEVLWKPSAPERGASSGPP